MKIKSLLNNIIDWNVDNKQFNRSNLNPAISDLEIDEIEHLLGETLPLDYRQLLKVANGQKLESNEMAFLGLKLVNHEEIINQLKFSNSLIKSELPKTSLESEKLIKAIIQFYKERAPKHSFLGLKKNWYKIEFDCGIGSYGGPYLYNKLETSKLDRVIFKIKDYSPLSKLIKKLHVIENNSWDELNFKLFADGKYELQRETHDLNSAISNPIRAIKEIYFHNKWLPIISDVGGNYIGYDLDPDINGKKGQIIIYGRDENELTVIADSLEVFLTNISDDLTFNNGDKLLNKYHLFDNIRKMNKLL